MDGGLISIIFIQEDTIITDSFLELSVSEFGDFVEIAGGGGFA